MKNFFYLLLVFLIQIPFQPLEASPNAPYFLLNSRDEEFQYPPRYEEDADLKEKEKKEAEKKKKEAEPTFPALFGLRIMMEVSTLRGAAFSYLENNFGYDQIVEAGYGAEIELSYRLSPSWYLYGSIDFISFPSTVDNVSQKTAGNNGTLTPIDFKGWQHYNLALGGKYYPFSEEKGFLPYLKIGIGVTVQSELKSNFQGTETVHFTARGGAAFELGAGMEYRILFDSFRMAIVVEAMVVRLTKQKGDLTRGSNNTYAFPLKIGAIIYF